MIIDKSSRELFFKWVKIKSEKYGVIILLKYTGNNKEFWEAHRRLSAFGRYYANPQVLPNQYYNNTDHIDGFYETFDKYPTIIYYESAMQHGKVAQQVFDEFRDLCNNGLGTFRETEDLVREYSNTKYDDIPPYIESDRDYQNEGIEFALRRKRAMIAGEVGTGKTIMALRAVESLIEYGFVDRCIWVTNNNPLIQETKREIAKFEINQSHLIHLINYEKLVSAERKDDKNWPTKLFNLKAGERFVLVFDESHRVQKTSTATYRTCQKLTNLSERTYILSGTPETNRHESLIGQLKLLGHEIVKNQEKFKTRYCGKDVKESLSLELHRLTKDYIYRVKTDMVMNLPEFKRTKIELVLSDEDRKYIDGAIDRWIQEKEKEGKSINYYISSLQDILEELRETARVKVPFIVHIAQEKLKSGKLIIFTKHEEIAKSLAVCLEAYNPLLLTGSTNKNKRVEITRNFRDGDSRLLITTMKVGGVGINYKDKFGNIVVQNSIFAELDLIPYTHEQAEGRTRRSGQQLSGEWIYPVFKNTLEDRVYSMLARKLNSASLSLDGKRNTKDFLEEASIVQSLKLDREYGIAGSKRLTLLESKI